MQTRLMFLTLTLLACGRSTTVGPYDPAAPAEETQSTEAEGTTLQDPLKACTALGKVCGTGAGKSKACCGSARCIEFTVYDYRRCSIGNADGAYCYTNEQCQSLNCQGAQCVKACKAQGAVCGSDASCCPGTFCDGNTYGYAPPR